MGRTPPGMLAFETLLALALIGCFRHSDAAAVLGLGFNDTDPEPGKIGGPVAWNDPPGGPFQKRGYLAGDATGSTFRLTISSLLGSSATSFTIPVGTDLRNATHILVYTVDSFGAEDSEPAAVSAVDVGIPAGVVTITEFFDLDFRVGLLRGFLRWSPPSDLRALERYEVYLATGTDRRHLGSVQVGTNDFDVPQGTPILSSNQFRVHAASGDGEQQVFASFPVVDRAIPPLSAENLTMVDQDPGIDLIGGTMSWQPPASMDFITKYVLYQSPTAVGNSFTRVLLKEVPGGDSSVDIPLGTSTSGYPWLLLYSANDYALETSPAVLAVSDIDAQLPISVVTGLTFTDQDIDRGEIQGTVSWQPPSSMTSVTGYKIYLTANATGADGTLIGSTAVGVNQLAVAANTPLAGATHVAVFTSGVFMQAPSGAVLEIQDIGLPVLGVVNLYFEDSDTTAGKIGGTLTWEPPNTTDVTHYVVYFASDAAASSKTQIGTLPFGTHSIDIAQGTLLGTYWYLAVYTANSVGEQRTPSTVVISDFGIEFADTDLREGLLGGTASWPPFGAPGAVRQRVYLATAPSSGPGARAELGLGAVSQVSFVRTEEVDVLLSRLGAGLRLAADLLRPTPEGIIVAAPQGSRILDALSFIGQAPTQASLSALPLPFDLAFGFDVPAAAISFEVMAGTTLAPYAYIQVMSEDAGGIPLAQQAGPIVDLAAPAFPPRDVVMDDVDFDGRRIGGVMRWNPPESMHLVTRYAAYLAPDPDASESNMTFLAEVPKATLEVLVPGGTPVQPWAIVFAGSGAGFGAVPGVGRIRDVALRGAFRQRLESAVCQR